MVKCFNDDGSGGGGDYDGLKRIVTRWYLKFELESDVNLKIHFICHVLPSYVKRLYCRKLFLKRASSIAQYKSRPTFRTGTMYRVDNQVT